MTDKESFSQVLSHLQLNIKSILGTSAKTPNNFVIEGSLMAYTASGGVVVCQLDLTSNKIISQRFFCANKSGLTNNNSNFNPSSANAYLNMAYAEVSKQDACTPTEALKDSYGFTISAEPIIVKGNSLNINGDNKNSPKASDAIDLSSPSKLKDRVRSINCISLSRDNKILAIGESGYQPRILLFSLAPDLSNSPIALIYEHSFGINSITFSADSKYFCSLGLINDGFLNVWKLGTNSVQLVASNKCSSIINQVIWHENFIITLGLRLIKVWRYQYNDNSDEKSLQKPSILKGKSVLLGLLINCNFISGDILNNDELLVIANNCQLLLLKLTYENLKLVCLDGPKYLFQCLLVDYELNRVWFGSDNYHIEHLDFQEITASINQTPSHSPTNKINSMFGCAALSPTKVEQRVNHSILKLANFSKAFLVYLTDSEEVVMYDKDNCKASRNLVNSLMKNLSGIKYTYLNDLLIFSKHGAIKQVEESESDNDKLRSILQFELPANELIANSLTAVDANDSNLILGDKYGNIYVTKTTIDLKYDIIYQIKAHSSAVNDILYFKIDEVEFISSISRDRMIQIFYKPNNLDWDILQTLPLHTGNLLKFLYNDKKLYVCSADRTISVHKFELEGDSVKVYQDKVISIKNSPINMKIFGDDLIISTNDKNMLIYSISENLEFKRLLKLYNDKTNESLLVENFTIHKNLIIVASSDKSIRSFSYFLGKPLAVSWGHLDSILSLILKPDTNQLISISMDGCLFKWEFIEMSSKQSASAEANIPSSVTPDSVPLYSKVTRKIIPTSGTTNLSSNSPFKPLLPKLNTRHSNLPENESQDDLTLSPSPSSRLTNATLKRLQAKKMATDGSSPSRSNSIRSSDSPSRRNPSRVDSNTALLPPKTLPTKSNISPLRKKATVELSGSPRKPLNTNVFNSRRASIKTNSIDNQEEFMERSIAHLTMIKSHLAKEAISTSNREVLKKEVEEISALLGSNNSQMDKENQLIGGFKELRIEDPKETDYEEKLLEKYSERLIQIFNDKVKDRSLNGINSKGIFTKLYSTENYSTNDVD